MDRFHRKARALIDRLLAEGEYEKAKDLDHCLKTIDKLLGELPEEEEQ